MNVQKALPQRDYQKDPSSPTKLGHSKLLPVLLKVGILDRQTYEQADIATFRLNGPWGRFSENIQVCC